MAGFESDHLIDGEDDNFLSASGKSRKEKRAEKKAVKEEKLRQKKGAEISASISESLGGALGIPIMAPVKEKKKGLLARLKENRQEKKADKLYKKDYERSAKAGTLSKANFPTAPAPEAEKKKIDLSAVKEVGLGIAKLFSPEAEEEETPTKPAKKQFDTGQAVKFGIIGLGVLALGVILFSKGMPDQKQTK